MDYKVVIAADVHTDILESIDWYNEQQNGLGFEFYNAILECIDAIQHNPFAFAIRYDVVFRICFLKRFPFGIHYCVEENTIKILLAAHAKRNPKNWSLSKKRRKE